MNNEHSVIHDFEFQLIGNLFRTLDRQGPGSEEVTKLALQFIEGLSENSHIADIGCGTGGQTIHLAKHTKGQITAIDLMPEFVEVMNSRLKQSIFKDRIKVIEASMAEPPFQEEEFDLIWAEGSIYHIGYENGLQQLRKYLKPNGIIAVSEASWFTDNPPAEIAAFWDQNYPEIDTIDKKIHQMQNAGYKPIAHFILPEIAWWNYFNPITERIESFLKEQNYSKEAKGLAAQVEEEKALYGKYKKYYGYVFYIGQKIND